VRHQAELRQVIPLDRPIKRAPGMMDFLDGFGWHPPFPPTPQEREDATRLVLAHYGRLLPGARLEKGPTLALTALLGECRARGIPTALLLMPEAASFRALYPESFLSSVDDLLQKLGEEHGSLLIDGRMWSADEDFNDPHHLHRDGAIAFTTRFAREAMSSLRERLPPLTREARLREARLRHTAGSTP
jgi:hypothetical protein